MAVEDGPGGVDKHRLTGGLKVDGWSSFHMGLVGHPQPEVRFDRAVHLTAGVGRS
jgi:hypothetical protein